MKALAGIFVGYMVVAIITGPTRYQKMKEANAILGGVRG